MEKGQMVEVQQVWASQGRLKAPLKAWFKGYEFVRMDGRVAVVKIASGSYNNGMEVRYPSEDVRPT